MLQDLTGGNPAIVIAIFVGVVWLLIRYSGDHGKNGEE